MSPHERSNLATWRAMEARRTGARDAGLLELEARVERCLLMMSAVESEEPDSETRLADWGPAQPERCMGCFYSVPLDGFCTCREYGDATCGHCRSEGGPEHTCQDDERDEEDGALDAADVENDQALLDRGGEW